MSLDDYFMFYNSNQLFFHRRSLENILFMRRFIGCLEKFHKIFCINIHFMSFISTKELDLTEDRDVKMRKTNTIKLLKHKHCIQTLGRLKQRISASFILRWLSKSPTEEPLMFYIWLLHQSLFKSGESFTITILQCFWYFLYIYLTQ